MGNQVSLLACGDINIQNRAEPAEVFARVKDILDAADLRIGNLEMCLSSPSDVITAKHGWKQSDAEVVKALTCAGFDAVTTANNVTFPASAMSRSLEVLDENRIAHTGSGADLAEARRPAIIEKSGTRVGLLGYTCIFYPLAHAATSSEPGVATVKCITAYEPHPRVSELPGGPAIVRSWPTPEAVASVAEDIAALRPQVDLVIAYFHMGVSSQEELTEYQRILSHAAIDAGAGIVMGASAHRPQAIEVYNGKVILYGLGNFAFDWWKVMHRKTGLLAELQLHDGQIEQVSIRPVRRTDDDANLVEILDAQSPAGAGIIDRVRELSAEFGTTFSLTDNGAVAVFQAKRA